MFVNAYEAHTDLALEANNGDFQSISGVESSHSIEEGIKITKIKIVDEQAARKIGKAKGTYVTLEVPGLRQKDTQLMERTGKLFAKQLREMIRSVNSDRYAKVLLIGLGNDRVTPDALGPIVVEHIFVTRHYFELMAEGVAGEFRAVSAIAPGVLGTTGIETSEIVRGIVANVKPDVVIAVDSLASRSLDRVHTTIQMADTGIQPGSGVGNKRKALNREALGVPVIAVGVPTVVYASTIVNNCIEMMKQHFQRNTQNSRESLGMLDEIGQEERLSVVREVLEPLGNDLLVTPKDIDQFMEDMGQLIADGINEALHEGVDFTQSSHYMH
jgi:spore protease